MIQPDWPWRIEADEIQQDTYTAKERGAPNRPDRANIAHTVFIEAWRYLLIEVYLILDNPGVGWIRPKNST